MTEHEWPPVKTPLRGRDPRFRVAAHAVTLLVTSACAAAAVGVAASAHAEPTDPYEYVPSATDTTFLGAIDRLGIKQPSGPEAVAIAKGACATIQQGNTIRDAVNGVRSAAPGMPLLQGAHFVAVARRLYCPNTPDY
ncbi:DUF732 domain-containing protein [Candidatus Mycobacterium methanotrophicum]|uniref:DUF732 domain-containing protein n=1 Tax=Candidatus Mycobacterium methanotrophicum TaxID=2943498 RepID=A0ABY4QGG8_9MYCO|nr:DUF732 domain-containing protein [Candidatus Mycobacterium methanotrophicum]UQX09929.1 DUF732 domain-containing protein [Candidatus Mycobacterium methanotrophicum]